ncbi:MAG: VWA domain-containing protein [Gemmatimonadales bacterium]|nr:VWA domain-containing protein [Gemmatimonadales bacterium]
MTMPCLNITNGLFLNAGPTWQTGNVTGTTANGATITNTAGGANPGCVVATASDSEFFPMPAGGSVRFLIFGNPANFVAVLTIQGGVGPVTRSVVLVDITGPSITTELLLTISADSTVSLPQIDPSQGTGSVFMLFAPTGSGPLANVHASIHRSVDGFALCAAVPFHPTMQVLGNATTTQLQVLEGSTVRASCPRPRGECQVTTDPVNFPDSVQGPGVNPALATSIRTATIRNDGNDCLTINSIGNVGPYIVVASSPPMPATLDPGDELDVDIRFAPPAGTAMFNVDLPINPAPGAGDTVIHCRGRARPPVAAIGFGANIAFGSIPVSSTATRTLTITNTGERTVNVGVPASPAGSEYVWAAFSGAIAPGSSAPGISIAFTPPSENAFPRTLSFTSDVQAIAHQVNLTGAGCMARARINPIVPPGPAIPFGQVQRGFRTVRLVRVQNTGNGQLTFRARIAGNPLFGIQVANGSVTAPLSQNTFTVNPPSICGAGATGSGEVLFAITFFADAVPSATPQTGQLIIDNHNDGTGSPAVFTFTLEAEIIAVVNADVEIVIDRSGSMDDSSGPRRKIDTALDAARLFVQLARPDVDDRVGMSRFNTVPEQVQGITPITSANQAAMVNGIIEANYAPSGGTSIAGGVLRAVADLDANPRSAPPPQLNKAVVVLTDANDNTPYTNPADGLAYTLLGEGSTNAVGVPPDVRLYGVGIGDAVDTGRLAQLCPTTGGQFLHVHDFAGLDFFKLEKHFTQIYMATVDLAQITDPTFVIQPNATHEHPFVLLRGDVTIMAVVYDRDGVRLPFWLRSPQGELVELTSIPPGFQIRPGITTSARFMEVRLPQGEPQRYAGQWHVVVRHDGQQCYAPGVPGASAWTGDQPSGLGTTHAAVGGGGFGFTSTRCKPNTKDPVMYGIALGAGSNFRMFPFLEPGVVSVGDPIRLNALITEFTLPVPGCTVTVDITAPDGTVRTVTLADDGVHDDGAVDDGDYGGHFLHTHQEGMYEFLFRAYGTSRDGESVTREATLSKYVEGREKLVPPERPGSKAECCTRIARWMRVLSIVLILILMISIWLATR